MLSFSSKESETSQTMLEASENNNLELGYDEEKIQALAASKAGSMELRSLIFKVNACILPLPCHALLLLFLILVKFKSDVNNILRLTICQGSYHVSSYLLLHLTVLTCIFILLLLPYRAVVF